LIQGSEMTEVAGNTAWGIGSIRKGRPPKPDAMSSAERTQRARSKRKEMGLSEVKCYLDDASRAYLVAVCEIHDCTISESIALALKSAILNGAVTDKAVG
jgi:hypothetical protein